MNIFYDENYGIYFRNRKSDMPFVRLSYHFGRALISGQSEQCWSIRSNTEGRGNGREWRGRMVGSESWSHHVTPTAYFQHFPEF